MKAPKPFNKRLTEKDYAKKVLKRLHIQGDREFIEGLYENETDEKTGKAYRITSYNVMLYEVITPSHEGFSFVGN